MFLGEKVNDFDVYFRDHDTTKKIAQYYVKRFSPKNQRGIPLTIYVDDTAERVKIHIKSAGVASEDGTTKEYQYFETRSDDEANDYISDIIQDPGDIEETFQETERAVLEAEDDGKEKYRPVFMSTNAITLSQRLRIALCWKQVPNLLNHPFAQIHQTWLDN